MTQDTTPHIHVSCYVRKSSIVAPVDSTLRTLERLEAEDVVDEFTVGAWPAEVDLEDPRPHGTVVDLFEAFDSWADQWNVSIRPPFSVETRHSEITDETRRVLLTPVQCLAVSVNGVLVEVFPHTADPAGDGDTYTVTDALDLLEAQDRLAFAVDQSPETPPDRRPATTDTGSEPGTETEAEGNAGAETGRDPDLCPACGIRLVTGQGLFACSNCDWVGIATGAGRYRPLEGDLIPQQPDSSTRTDDSTPPTLTR